MLYKVFIDDSGSKDYKDPYSRDLLENPPDADKYIDYWRRNYFVLTGVRIEQKDLDELNDKINRLKIITFKTHKVEIKSDWLRQPIQRKKYYLDPFDITAEQLNKFGLSLFDFIQRYRDSLKIISIVFDKRYYGDQRRATVEGNPLVKTSQVLFERLQYIGGYNIVIFDQMESNLDILSGQHGKIVKIYKTNEDMQQIFVKNYSNITDVSFSRSCDDNFLQLADICGYPVYQQFVKYGRQWSGEEGSMACYEYFDKVRCNFISKQGQVRGYGLTCIPDVNKHNWNILKDCEKLQKNST